ncbi:unnamed protein product [Macrosiphum euphorbiae]|uniref:Uncharacterized protein n=1 Tax=Macrosiphum euphorbiae TaxID=13131 RepID=A0AAV0YDV6_9HEMI|nr:unnamed protein product [Macrosiphum euphorbiae]CAI6377762.1 unnamed protein product [Macrosiphum euphorbiae]CAI6377764.1 unnamed protein product [Macrosiphum euphorbiae]CAI6377765.1 unnamed protein product [Macrosiphum euphorbiae]
MWAGDPNGTKRTTNGAESYHSQLWFEFYMHFPHPSVFKVIDVFIEQQVINEAQIPEIKKWTEAIQRKYDRELEANYWYISTCVY